MGKNKAAKGAYPEETKLYKRRWLLMTVFLIYTVNLGLHWVQCSSISNIITGYYGVSPHAVERTTLAFMVAYVVGVFPGLYVLGKLGIRYCLILVTLGIAAGSVIKLFSVAPDEFHILMIGQVIVAVSSVFCFGFIGHFMATWFGSEEIARAGALILFGDQFGGALSFLLPSLLVQNDENIKVVEQGLTQLHRVCAVIAIVTLILVVLLFKERPKIPPSFAQVKQLEEDKNVWNSIIEIFTQKSFILICLSYGLSLASQNALVTLLNQMIENNFKEKAQDAGKIGFVIMCSGMISSLICGYILDKTRCFKGNAVVLSLGGTVSTILFAVVLKLNNIVLVYITAALLGAFLLSYYATGVQMGIELVYPVSEGIVVSSMCLCTQVLSVATTTFHGYLIREYGDVTSNVGLIFYMLLSFIFACLTPANMKREETEKSATAAELEDFITKK